jgi:IS5 family transposase
MEARRPALVDARGVPPSLIVSGAAPHDSKKLRALLEARVAHPATR